MGVKYIKAKEIERWADGMSSQSELPLLIRWLIYGSIDEKNRGEFEFRALDAVQAPGPDGRLESDIRTSHVPKGYSIWELTNQGGNLTRRNGKADNDFRERTNKNIDYQPNKSTFLFVTGHSCSSKHKWVETTKKKQKLRKNKKKIWRNIKFYDSNDLEQWLESVPIAAWRIYTEIINKQPTSVETLDNYGKMWCYNRECKFTHRILLAGRIDKSALLKGWLNGEPKKIKITASRVNEVIAFVWAVIKEMNEERRELFFSRTLIVNNEYEFNKLIKSKYQQVFIYKDEKSISVNYATNRHHVIIPMTDENKIDIINDSFINLNPLPKDEFLKVFEDEMYKVDEERNKNVNYVDIFNRCNGDLGVLKEILN